MIMVTSNFWRWSVGAHNRRTPNTLWRLLIKMRFSFGIIALNLHVLVEFVCALEAAESGISNCFVGGDFDMAKRAKSFFSAGLRVSTNCRIVAGSVFGIHPLQRLASISPMR